MRWKWEPGSVAFWDNRVVAHRAVPGGYNPEEREGKRTAIFGERPFFDDANSVKLSDYRGKPTHIEDGKTSQVDVSATHNVKNGNINGVNGVKPAKDDTEGLNETNANVGP